MPRPAPTPAPRPPTPRQASILARIKVHISETGYPPTYQEIADHFGMKVSPVYMHLKALERKGYLSRIPGVARGLRVLKTPKPKEKP